MGRLLRPRQADVTNLIRLYIEEHMRCTASPSAIGRVLDGARNGTLGCSGSMQLRTFERLHELGRYFIEVTDFEKKVLQAYYHQWIGTQETIESHNGVLFGSQRPVKPRTEQVGEWLGMTGRQVRDVISSARGKIAKQLRRQREREV